ncbi:MAG: hypothetical protein ABSG33_01045 [Candidatus Bathyarchaeia archaeon]|jgi:hypothetical protein
MSVDVKAIIQNIIIALLTAAGLFCSILLLTYSWVKIAAIVAILIPGAFWLVAHGRVKRIFKYVVIATLIFAIVFGSFESFLLLNAGYPSTNVAQAGGTAGYTSILNLSLTQLIQGIEKSSTYALLTAEHGKTIPESITLDSSSFPEWVEVDFYGEGSNTYLAFMAPTAGSQYHVEVATYSSQLLSLPYVQSSSQQEFGEIDAKGLQSFYNLALQLAQNRTGTTPKIDGLALTMTVEDRIYMSYEGITVQIVGSYQGQSTLICDFEPDGTLIYMSQPAAA